jgi:MarR family transcriptional regulator, transcriptional regulator for hemolysin
MTKQSNLFDEMPLGRHFSVLTKMYYGALTKRLEKLDFDRNYSVLVFVQHVGKKCTQQFISDALRIDKASMVRVIDHLVKKGYLVRTTNPDDRREHWMELTSKAKKVLPVIQKEIKELNKIALQGLTKKEANDFKNALSSVCGNLGKLPSDRILVNYKKVKPSTNK